MFRVKVDMVLVGGGVVGGGSEVLTHCILRAQSVEDGAAEVVTNQRQVNVLLL